MSKRDRIERVIRGNTTDAQRYNFNITLENKTKIGIYYGIEPEEVENFIGNHLLYLRFDPPEDFVPQQIGNNLAKDEFGITWETKLSHKIGEWGMVDHPVKNMDLSGYQFPNPIGKGRFQTAVDFQNK